MFGSILKIWEFRIEKLTLKRPQIHLIIYKKHRQLSKKYGYSYNNNYYYLADYWEKGTDYGDKGTDY